MKSALVFPPQWYPSQPYLALPTLKAYLENRGHAADQYDFNIETYDVFLSSDYLARCIDKIRARLNVPAYLPEEKELKTVYRQILSDEDYLDSILAEVEEAKKVLRTEELFFQFPIYKKAYTTLKIAMKLVSYAHYPTRIDLESLYMPGAPEESLDGILHATADTVINPYIKLFRDHLIPRVNWEQYGLVGISIIHVGQVIPGLTLARLLRQRYANLHIVIGGSVFNRHAGVLHNKQILFEQFFHSVVLYEGEHPLERLVSALATDQPLRTVPNLMHLENGVVMRNESVKSLSYEQLARPDFDQLPLEKYLMPYPVLPYMASRGCYWGKCTFCTHSFIYDSYYRKENEARVAEELEFLGKRYQTRFFTFSDEAVSPNAFRRMSQAVIARNFEMRALAMMKFESNSVESPDLFEDMYRAGFIMLFYGLESANDRILSLIDKGTDKATESTVLRNSSQAGIWNHTYLFFGFPTENREEAEETVEFVIENGETGAGIIHSVGQSTFTLEKDSAIYHNPSGFAIERIVRHPDRDMAIMYDFEAKSGMSREEVMAVYESFNSVIETRFPTARIWRYLSREHFMLYLDRFGKEAIREMARQEELIDAV